MRRLVCAALVLVSLGACVSTEEKERRKEEAMIEQAQADAAAESVFVHDSINVAASITVDTVEFSRDSIVINDDAESESDRVQRVYRMFTRDRAVCIVDSMRFNTAQKGDTLSCQWAPPK